MLRKNEMLYQKKIEARLNAEKNRAKNRPLQASGNVKSQWGNVVTNENRLIDNGHYMKTSEQGTRDHLRDKLRKLKKESRKSTEIVLVKKV